MAAGTRDQPVTTSRTAPGVVLFFVLATAMTVAAGCGRDVRTKAGAADQLTLVTGNGRHEISIEIADTEEKKQVGLMFRTELKDSHGMLFPYDKPREITMWMRNTYISLDMIFIGQDGAVVRVARNAQPMSEDVISSQVPARAVLELKAGSADRYQIAAGSRVEHPIFKAPEAK